MPAPDTTRCPLCGQANACAVAAGLPAQGCWCMAATVSRAALARVPPAQRGRSCLCPHCAREVPAPSAPAADKIGAAVSLPSPCSTLQELSPCPPTTSK